MRKKTFTLEELDNRYKKVGENEFAEHLVHLWTMQDTDGNWNGGDNVDICVSEMIAGDRLNLIYRLMNITYSAGIYSIDERHYAMEIVNRLLGNWLPPYMRKL